MIKIELRILGISYTHAQTTAYALILAEKSGLRRLPIVIGNFEAQSIAIELEKMKPTRPLTHDLFKSFTKVFNINVNEVVITKFEEGVFHASIICSNGIKEEVLDARTSDAVAIAIRLNAPIYTYESVLETAGIILDVENEEKKTKTTEKKKPSPTPKSEPDFSDFSQFTIKELEALLKTSVEKEEYEKASQIRDEIQKRKTKKKK